MARTLVLFDVDGTLVDVRGAGRRSFQDALVDAYGIHDDLHDVTFAGATDLGVLAQLSARLPFPPDDRPHHRRFFAALTPALQRLLNATPPVALPGAVDVVAALKGRDDVVMGLVTGNAKGTAALKVERAGLDASAFGVGGYGCDHPDRDVLAARAKDLATTAHGAFDRVVLVGDTASDVRAAQSIGALALVIPFGAGTADGLRAAGADVVLERLDELLRYVV